MRVYIRTHTHTHIPIKLESIKDPINIKKRIDSGCVCTYVHTQTHTYL